MTIQHAPKEKTFQQDFIADTAKNGYIQRRPADFDRHTCLDMEMFFEYLQDTQSDVLAAISKHYKSKKTPQQVRELIVSSYITAVDDKGLAHTISHGFGIDSDKFHLDVSCKKPSNGLNRALVQRYAKNRYSIIAEAYIDDNNQERIDVLIFRNGILYMMDELKYTKAGQSYKHAIKQWKEERKSGCRAMQPDVGCLVYIAQDEHEVYFTTNVQTSGFLPFNEGSNKTGDLRKIGAGNDLEFGRKYKTSYFSEDILEPSAFDYIFDEMVLSEVRDDPTFPRFHQYATVHYIDEMTEPLTSSGSPVKSLRFLTQQAPGAGKTLEITWAPLLLARKTNAVGTPIYGKVIIVTDRIAAVRNLADDLLSAGCIPNGFVAYAEKSSRELLDLLQSNCRIIITSSQKFIHKAREIAMYSAKQSVRYGVFIDEAHDNTEGKNQSDIVNSLRGKADVYDAIGNNISPTNMVDFFAFTATPKPTTLELFGLDDGNGNFRPHTVYSMKQAIEEGFIIDVLQNVMCVSTTHIAEKTTGEDPTYQTNRAKRALQEEAEQSWEFIRYNRIPTIIEHFRSEVDGKLLAGKEKAMVICLGIEAAVKYRLAAEGNM